MEKERKRRKHIRARVVSDKMEKTRVVVLESRWRHPIFGKSLIRSRRFKIHDEKNQSHIGDIVDVVETRPLSRDKRYRLLSIVEKAK